MNQVQPNEAQKALINFINPTDATDIAKSLRKVFNMALFENSSTVTCKEKDDLYYLEKIISITEKM